MADTNTNQEPNTNEPQVQDQNEPKNNNFDELFSKLDGAIEKRFDGLAKSMLKSNGVKEDDVAGIADAYKQYRSGKAEQSAQALTSAQQENASLKAQVLEMQINSIATTQADKLCIDSKSVQYVTQLANLSDCVGEDGKPDEEKIAEAMKKVLDDVPAFKKAEEQQGNGFKIGADSNQNAVNEHDARLRRAFGLK